MGRPIINLVGQRFGKLVVMGESKQRASNGGMYWFCKCDCGNYTEVQASHLKRKEGKGNTTTCGRCPIESVNTFNLSECGTYYTGTTQKGKKFLFDAEDYTEVSKHSWCFDYGYIGSFINGKKVRLHRFIMTSKHKYIDHINHDTTDNRKANLRACTNQQNIFNQRKRKNTTSKYKGVTWWKRDKNWRAATRYEGKTIHLGYFATEEEAAKAYNEKAKELHGEFAKLNKIEV